MRSSWLRPTTNSKRRAPVCSAQDDVNGQKQFIDESAAEIAHLNEKSKELGGKVAHRDADLKQIRFERSDLQNKSRDRMGEAQE